jgi:hypothetical protein
MCFSRVLLLFWPRIYDRRRSRAKPNPACELLMWREFGFIDGRQLEHPAGQFSVSDNRTRIEGSLTGLHWLVLRPRHMRDLVR